MTLKEVRDYLASLTSHITFEYNGYSCGIDPLSRNKFVMWSADKKLAVESIDAVMTTEFFSGSSLKDIWDDIVALEY